MDKFLKCLDPLYPEIPWQFVLLSAEDGEGKIKGMFQVKAPHYLVCYTGKGEHAARQAGYLTEQAVLYLTAHGIGTCYQGGARAELQDEPEGMEQQIIVAFGYAEGRLYREPHSANRRELSGLCVFKDTPTQELTEILTAARLAPSAVNGQPWRFVVYKNRIHVFLHEGMLRGPFSGRMQEVDMGIVLCHLAVAAEELWLDAHLVYHAQLADRRVKGNVYVMSLVFQE